MSENIATEDVGTMLPNIGLDGQPAIDKKKKDKYVLQPEDEYDINISESVFNYMNNTQEYDYEVEEGVKEIVGRIVERPIVSAKLARLVTSIYINKKRLKRATISENPNTIAKLKQKLIRDQLELNSIKKTASPRVLEDIKKVEANLEKNTKKFEVRKDTSINNNEEVKKESVDIMNNEMVFTEAGDEKKTVSPELKRLDEIRAQIANIERDIDKLKGERSAAQKQLDKTGEKRYENKVKGFTAKIEKLESDKKKKEEELSSKEKKLKKEEEKIIKESAFYEAANMEDEIRPIVDELNRKGYKVRYASPGHTNLRKKEDKEPDGVYYGKLYSDARIMFDDTYTFPPAPKYWHWREVDGCSYLDISPESYDSKDGSPDEAFSKWKTNYMNSLKSYVDELKSNGSKSNSKEEKQEEEVKESLDVFAEDIIDSIFESMGMDEILSEENVTE